ncbi:Sb-PDE family phosphodiesterase [Neolewinella agarilytica]|uniref:Sb-PDE family phosphodiesterase n=1 Tax=Neolewinella agarilytica TaxID=478744 RepID=UPI0023549609|nr:Sb-PDE family phosphodiesterase [Neolewinella agarilytica]
MKTTTCLLFSLFCFPLLAQQHQHHSHERGIHFPDTRDYLTLIVDLHSHSVFSDGSVWPDIRIQEAVRDSLDAFSFTEHLEYQPHAADIPHPDRNRAHDLGEELARPYDLMVIRGAEITRSLPPGHTNAVFIEDANKLIVDDPMEAFLEANRQGGFTFWNHPNWVAQRKDGVAELTPMHRELIDKGLLHGIEVVNDLTISKEALQVALDNDLTIMGTSDVHGLVDWQYHVHEGGHRPVTLVLAEEKNQASLKAALMAGRTVAWFENTLVGKEEHLKAVVEASLSVEDAAYRGPSSVIDITIHNESDCEYILENTSGYSLQSDLGLIELHPNASTTIQVMTLRQLATVDLKFKVLNAVTAPEERLEITLSVKADN